MIKIGKTDRVSMFGTTGSGKSYYMRHLLYGLRRVIVLDSKHEFDLPNATIVSKFDPRIDRQIFRPTIRRDMTLADQYEAYLEDVWARRWPCVVYADEVNDLCRSRATVIAPYDRMLRQGRSAHICAWSSSQIPAELPSIIFSQSQHIFSFALTYEPHRKKIEQFTADGAAARIAKLREYECLYYHVPRRFMQIVPPLRVGRDEVLIRTVRDSAQPQRSSTVQDVPLTDRLSAWFHGR